jgi:hypothetical protein
MLIYIKLNSLFDATKIVFLEAIITTSINEFFIHAMAISGHE